MYQQVRDLKTEQHYAKDEIIAILNTLKTNHQNDWLLPLECMELAYKQDYSDLTNVIKNKLVEISKKRPEIAHLISDGIALIKQSE